MKTLRGEISAKVIEIREILGKQAYVVETERGTREAVGVSQIGKVVEQYEEA